MKIPYNQIYIHGEVLFAARSGHIHTFNLVNGTHISVWSHPDTEKVVESVRDIAEGAKDQMKEVIEEENDGPPAKRQKTVEAEDASTATDMKIDVPEDGVVEGEKVKIGKKAKNKGRRQQNSSASKLSKMPKPDRPVETHLTGTTDGKHVIAVTGHDKTVWVLEHDGQGALKQLSQRAMPKRPSAIQVASDGQIICADKFGDIYALPLIPDTNYKAPQPTSAPEPRSKPQATTLTVHSKRNLGALKEQQKQIDLKRAGKGEVKAAGPDFELTLLLGHVSMLTALELGEHEGRRYILSADRDEHVRVSRYIPQAHVIESFCLGHKEFIGAIAIPETKPNLLISGGGDNDLFIWDWRSGRLLSKASVLRLVTEIAPETTKVAVFGVTSVVSSTDQGSVTHILAICEDIKAIFTWKLTDENELHHPSVIQLPGKPLHLTTVPGVQVPKVVVAIDAGEDSSARSLNIYSLQVNDERLAVDTVLNLPEDAVVTDDLEVTAEEVRSLLYGIENLRKDATEEAKAATEETDAQGTPVEAE